MSGEATGERRGRRRIDAHLHLWDLDRCDYSWLGPEHGPLYRTFRPGDIRPELDAARIDEAVLVQAADSACDTDLMLDLARSQPWIVGVVGWLDLRDPDAVSRDLEAGRGKVLCGVRHLVHNDPDPHMLSDPSVRRSLRLLADAGLAFDVPDAWPAHLAETCRIGADIDDLTIVVDHLGKPPVGGDLRDWAATLRQVAVMPNTVAKFSGLATSLAPGASWSAGSVRTVWEIALELFEPDRLMYGGDWPLPLPMGGYPAMWEVMATLIGELGPDEQDAVLGGTAARVYQL